MVLANTLSLIQAYGPALIDGSITDEQLQTLESQFKPVGKYRDVTTTPYSDAHHKTDEAMGDFVVAIGPHIPQDILHTLVDRLITNTNADPKQNMLFRGSKLEKYFVAYEIMTNSSSAQQHCATGGAIYKFFQKSTNDENAVKRQADNTVDMTHMSKLEMEKIQKKQEQEQNLIVFALDAHDDSQKKACLEQRHQLFQALDAALQETPPSLEQSVADNIKVQSDTALLKIIPLIKYNDLIEMQETQEQQQPYELSISGLMRLLEALIARLFSSELKPQTSQDTIHQNMKTFKEAVSEIQPPQQDAEADDASHHTPPDTTDYSSKK
jgi:hypothetical protein